VASVSTPQKPHLACPRSLAPGDRGDSGPQLAGRSPRYSGIGPGNRRCRTQHSPTHHLAPKLFPAVLQIDSPSRRTTKPEIRDQCTLSTHTHPVSPSLSPRLSIPYSLFPAFTSLPFSRRKTLSSMQNTRKMAQKHAPKPFLTCLWEILCEPLLLLGQFHGSTHP
jgi:hypothetical protein